MSFQGLPQDQEKIDPKDLARELKNAFAAFYDNKKAALERRKLDLAALKSRANIDDTSLRTVTNNLIRKLYNE